MDSKVTDQTKIVKDSFRLDVRKNFFSDWVVDACYELPQFVVDAETVNSFKAGFDKFYASFKHLEAGGLQVNLYWASVLKITS